MASGRGVQLTMLVGRLPRPAPESLLAALTRVEVIHSEDGRSGFQLVFQSDREGLLGLRDHPLLRVSQFEPFSRVVLMVVFLGRPSVLIDGFITEQHADVAGTGASEITITGEDVSILMDLEEKAVEHPAQSDFVIATKILARYSRYGVVPNVIPPPVRLAPRPTDRVPVQVGTDFDHLQLSAARYGYVFFIEPGPLPGSSRAYWGPPKRTLSPQPALTVGMGNSSNVESISFRYDSLAASKVTGSILDRGNAQLRRIRADNADRLALARRPALRSQSHVRTALLRQAGYLTAAEAKARASAIASYSSDSVVVANGQLDTMAYGGLLQARRLVGVRGVGQSHDGTYYVSRVNHRIDVLESRYVQVFQLKREGTGTLVPVVRP